MAKKLSAAEIEAGIKHILQLPGREKTGEEKDATRTDIQVSDVGETPGTGSGGVRPDSGTVAQAGFKQASPDPDKRNRDLQDSRVSSDHHKQLKDEKKGRKRQKKRTGQSTSSEHPGPGPGAQPLDPGTNSGQRSNPHDPETNTGHRSGGSRGKQDQYPGNQFQQPFSFFTDSVQAKLGDHYDHRGQSPQKSYDSRHHGHKGRQESPAAQTDVGGRGQGSTPANVGGRGQGSVPEDQGSEKANKKKKNKKKTSGADTEVVVGIKKSSNEPHYVGSDMKAQTERNPKKFKDPRDVSQPKGHSGNFVLAEDDHTVLAELEKDRIFPLRKKSLKFPRAKFFCRLCEYHCDTVDVCRQHVRDARHIRHKEVIEKEFLLKSMPPPSGRQLTAIDQLVEQVFLTQGLSEEDLAYRQQLTGELESVLAKALPGIKLRLYGSSLTGFGLKTSDINMDLVVPPDTNAAKTLTVVFKTLKESEKYHNVRSDFSAKIPGVLFDDPGSQVLCQISINSGLANQTSLLLQAYGRLDSRVRKLATLLRYWGKLCKIDRQAEGTLPSYSLSLMAVYFLQQCSPPVIPIMYTGMSAAVGDQNGKTGRDVPRCECDFDAIQQKWQGWKSRNTDSIGALWLQLLNFYSLKFDCATFIVSVKQKDPMKRAEKKWNSKRIAIEDPFSTKRNVARAVGNTRIFEYIYDSFRKAYLYFGLPTNYNHVPKTLCQTDKVPPKHVVSTQSKQAVSQHINIPVPKSEQKSPCEGKQQPEATESRQNANSGVTGNSQKLDSDLTGKSPSPCATSDNRCRDLEKDIESRNVCENTAKTCDINKTENKDKPKEIDKMSGMSGEKDSKGEDVICIDTVNEADILLCLDQTSELPKSQEVDESIRKDLSEEVSSFQVQDLADTCEESEGERCKVCHSETCEGCHGDTTDRRQLYQFVREYAESIVERAVLEVSQKCDEYTDFEPSVETQSPILSEETPSPGPNVDTVSPESGAETQASGPNIETPPPEPSEEMSQSRPSLETPGPGVSEEVPCNSVSINTEGDGDILPVKEEMNGEELKENVGLSSDVQPPSEDERGLQTADIVQESSKSVTPHSEITGVSCDVSEIPGPVNDITGTPPDDDSNRSPADGEDVRKKPTNDHVRSDEESRTGDGRGTPDLAPSVPTMEVDEDGALYDYVFTEKSLSDGKGPAVICGICDQEGHLKHSCPEEKLPELCQLPPMTKGHLQILTYTIKQVIRDFAPSPQEVQERERIRWETEKFIQENLYSDSKLHLFGSSCNGFGFKQSDLDICVTFDGKLPESLDYFEIIEKITQLLKTHRGLYNVFSIPTAKVPIVKYRHRRSQLEADISLYNTLAQHNTQMLHTYCCIDPRVRILGYAIKVFAKVCDIGDASKGSLSSYAYILMLLHYLQQCKPPVIPVLQELYEGSTKPELIIDGWNAWFLDDLRKLPKLWPSYGKNNQSVGELWLGMFRYYTEEFNCKDYAVCIRQKELLTRFEKLWNGSCIAIEDPFDLGHNLGAGLSRKMNNYILKAFINGRRLYCVPIKCIPDGFPTPGDYFFDADQLTEGKPPNDRCCRVCNKIGHIAKECPVVLNRKERDKERRQREEQIHEREMERRRWEERQRRETKENSRKQSSDFARDPSSPMRSMSVPQGQGYSPQQRLFFFNQSHRSQSDPAGGTANINNGRQTQASQPIPIAVNNRQHGGESFSPNQGRQLQKSASGSLPTYMSPPGRQSTSRQEPTPNQSHYRSSGSQRQVSVSPGAQRQVYGNAREGPPGLGITVRNELYQSGRNHGNPSGRSQESHHQPRSHSQN